MKYSLVLVALVAMFGITACDKPAAKASYSGPDKVAYDAAVEKCKKIAFDSRDKCVKDAMAALPK
jgi:uncharacterized lipoprotein YajG